jgi:hypothetical protein
MYQLAVKLPYPVQDTKGTAKYDKASKSLTVTLPVKPPAAVSHASAASATPLEVCVRQRGAGAVG